MIIWLLRKIKQSNVNELKDKVLGGKPVGPLQAFSAIHPPEIVPYLSGVSVLQFPSPSERQ